MVKLTVHPGGWNHMQFETAETSVLTG